jgi:bis(5'-nucleosyl)-tetraphosphatase (symmetrical)
MEFDTKDDADNPPAGYMPWFDVPGRRTGHVPIAFGHWSTLGTVHRENLLPLDTGCVWGGCLTAARLGITPGSMERISVKCPQARKPGNN